MAGYMTTIRIYNDPNDKRTFVRQMVQDFQEYEGISDFKASLFELTKEYFSDENISLQDVNIGFVGASNQKSFVNTSQQVYHAYNSRFLHKHNELVLFIERHKEKRQTKKRCASTLGPVVQKPINANPRLKVNQGVYFCTLRCCSTLIFGKTLH